MIYKCNSVREGKGVPEHHLRPRMLTCYLLQWLSVQQDVMSKIDAMLQG